MWSVRHAMLNGSRLSSQQRSAVLALAQSPKVLRDTVYSFFFHQPVQLLINRTKAEKPSWVHHFPAPEDPGYLLFSGLDPIVKHGVISLIRISDGKEIARWDPHWSEILKHVSSNKWRENSTENGVLPVHPLLLSDGAIIFNTSINAMVRINACENKPAWVLDNEILHHSNEISFDGTIWSPGIAQDGFPTNPWLTEHLRDDALVHLTTDGKLIEKRSFSKILFSNGLGVMLLGRSGNLFNDDPIHMNQISIAFKDSAYWKRGDLLISARHLSTIFLYRPSTNKIIWYQQGPWMNQHSVRFVDDHRISIFDNHVYGGAQWSNPFLSPSDINRVFIYDFANKQSTQPFKAVLKEARPITLTDGQAQILPDGGLFIEETNFGRHLRFSADHLLWSRINDYNEKYIGMVGWSRYLTTNDVKMPLAAISACSVKKLP